MGGELGMRLLRQLQMATSARTLLRLIRTTPVPTVGAVRVLGVAIRKGHTYGIILVDLERHRPLKLLRRSRY